MVVDVSVMASVRHFADEVGARFPAAHVLVNNAGAWFTERRETSEGHEQTFATNALGPYLGLTRFGGHLSKQVRVVHGEGRQAEEATAHAT